MHPDFPLGPIDDRSEDTDFGDESDRLVRLGINTTPRPQTVSVDRTFNGSDIRISNLPHTIGNVESLSVNGTIRYNDEELDARINRMIEQRLSQYTDQLDSYIQQVVIPHIDDQLQHRREEQ